MSLAQIQHHWHDIPGQAPPPSLHLVHVRQAKLFLLGGEGPGLSAGLVGTHGEEG